MERKETIMIQITKYQCETCGTCYDEAVECQACEAFHVSVNSVLKYQYSPKGMGPESKYPHAVIVKMNDNEDLIFKR